jgi:hypothetical protein
VLSGMVDIAFGLVLLFTDALHIENSPFPVYVICLIIGLLYFSLGILIAIMKMRKQKK